MVVVCLFVLFCCFGVRLCLMFGVLVLSCVALINLLVYCVCFDSGGLFPVCWIAGLLCCFGRCFALLLCLLICV